MPRMKTLELTRRPAGGPGDAVPAHDSTSCRMQRNGSRYCLISVIDCLALEHGRLLLGSPSMRKRETPVCKVWQCSCDVYAALHASGPLVLGGMHAALAAP